MARVRDITGARFGRLVAVRWASDRARSTGGRVWECRCDCGSLAYVSVGALSSGNTSSCGCLHREVIAAIGRRGTIHGKTRSGERFSWQAMHVRCSNPDDKDFHRYGGRGIKVCERWRSFVNFLEDMGERPPGTTLDRIDVNGGYEPGNCRWASHKAQANNKRNNVVVEHEGRCMTIAEWASIVGLERKTLEYRIRAGWAPSRALTTPSTISRKNHGRETHFDA